MVLLGRHLRRSSSTAPFSGTDRARLRPESAFDLFAPRLILGISDEISAHGDIERIRRVGELVDDYNARL